MAANTPKQKTMESNHKVGTFLSTGLFVIVCGFIAFPLVAGFLGSFRPGSEVVTKGLSLDFKSPLSLNNYKYLFAMFNPNNKDQTALVDSRKYFMWYKNSLVLTITTVILTLLVCYFIAYGLTMYKFKLGGFLFFMVIATMSVPFEILMLPLYQEITVLGIINSNAGVILPGLCAAGTIFFFRQYMTTLPKELLDAARVDGCTEYGISVKIMMPITKPAFASQAIMCAMGSWNNMLWPMMVFRDTSKFTLQIGLNTLLTPYGNNYDLLIAGSMFGILPILVIYLIFNRYLVDGMTSGAVKG
ncbi:MAG: carbohydrate ABC transporter permease [Eubacteriales bacterium]|nr:carbohydrate ABC transporter permease [Eubacteriales bacterium]